MLSLDNLIEAEDIPPVIAALVQTRDRSGEYAGGQRHARCLVQELLPTKATVPRGTMSWPGNAPTIATMRLLGER